MKWKERKAPNKKIDQAATKSAKAKADPKRLKLKAQQLREKQAEAEKMKADLLQTKQRKMKEEAGIKTESGCTGKGNGGGGVWKAVDGKRGKARAKKSRNAGLNKVTPLDEENFPSLSAQAKEQKPPRSPVKKSAGKNKRVQPNLPQPSPRRGGATASVLDLEDPSERCLSPVGAKTLSFAEGLKNDSNKNDSSEEELEEEPAGPYATGFVPPHAMAHHKSAANSTSKPDVVHLENSSDDPSVDSKESPFKASGLSKNLKEVRTSTSELGNKIKAQEEAMEVDKDSEVDLGGVRETNLNEEDKEEAATNKRSNQCKGIDEEVESVTPADTPASKAASSNAMEPKQKEDVNARQQASARSIPQVITCTTTTVTCTCNRPSFAPEDR